MIAGNGTHRVAVVGNGAMGTLFATALAAVVDVAVLSRTSDPAEVRGSSLVFVLVKTYDTSAALAPLRAHLDANAVLLTLQNGLDNDRLISQLTGRAAFAGVTTESATRIADGGVARGGAGATILPAHRDADRFEGVLRAGGFAVRRTDDIASALWRKLVANAAINSVTALAGVTNGDLWRDLALRERALGIAHETAAIATALGIAVGDPVEIVETVVRATAANRSSMLQDLERRRPTEADAILGVALRHAREQCLAVPALEDAYTALAARTSLP